MAHPNVHAESSVKKFGGKIEDYLKIHEWFDDTKGFLPDMRHRALKHHSQGIFECERLFGNYIINSDGKKVYTRYIGEAHVIEDMGFIPTVEDWFENIELQQWMMNRSRKTKNIIQNRSDKLPKSLIKIIK